TQERKRATQRDPHVQPALLHSPEERPFPSHTLTHSHTHISTHTHTSTHTHISTHTHTPTHTHSHTHTHTHTHTQSRGPEQEGHALWSGEPDWPTPVPFKHTTKQVLTQELLKGATNQPSIRRGTAYTHSFSLLHKRAHTHTHTRSEEHTHTHTHLSKMCKWKTTVSDFFIIKTHRHTLTLRLFVAVEEDDVSG